MVNGLLLQQSNWGGIVTTNEVATAHNAVTLHKGGII